MKFLRASLSTVLELPLLPERSDVVVPVAAELIVAVAATGVPTGLALAAMPVIPMLPVKVSNRPPTEGGGCLKCPTDLLEGGGLTINSGSSTSPVTTSPKACATMNALQKDRKSESIYQTCLLKMGCMVNHNAHECILVKS
jgi:hypothetical protein